MPGAGIRFCIFTIAVITILVLLSGCTMAPGGNNLTVTPAENLAGTPHPTSSFDRITVTGQVFFRGDAATGAPVQAMALDGTDNVSTYADQNGTYTVRIKRGVPYNVTAFYMGYHHTIWPVVAWHSYSDQVSGYNITLTTVPEATMEGRTVHHIFVEATAEKGGQAISTVSGYNGTYRLELQPDAYYMLYAKDYYNQTPFYIQFMGPNRYRGEYFDGYRIAVHQNETALIDIDALAPM